MGTPSHKGGRAMAYLHNRSEISSHEAFYAVTGVIRHETEPSTTRQSASPEADSCRGKKNRIQDPQDPTAKWLDRIQCYALDCVTNNC